MPFFWGGGEAESKRTFVFNNAKEGFYGYVFQFFTERGNLRKNQRTFKSVNTHTKRKKMERQPPIVEVKNDNSKALPTLHNLFQNVCVCAQW